MMLARIRIPWRVLRIILVRFHRLDRSKSPATLVNMSLRFANLINYAIINVLIPCIHQYS